MEEFDVDGDGYLGVKDIEKVNAEVGEIVNRNDVERMVERVSGNGKKISKKDVGGIMWR
jgi:Ca2+-binding EF-hand superfamily protein